MLFCLRFHASFCNFLPLQWKTSVMQNFYQMSNIFSLVAFQITHIHTCVLHYKSIHYKYSSIWATLTPLWYREFWCRNSVSWLPCKCLDKACWLSAKQSSNSSVVHPGEWRSSAGHPLSYAELNPMHQSSNAPLQIILFQKQYYLYDFSVAQKSFIHTWKIYQEFNKIYLALQTIHSAWMLISKKKVSIAHYRGILVSFLRKLMPTIL